MTNAIWSSQKALAAALTDAGVTTFPALPERATAPFRYVLLDTLEPGSTFGSYNVSFQVLCVGKPGQNTAVVEQVTDLAVEVIRAVPDIDGYALGSPVVGQLGDFLLNGTPHLAAPVIVNARISRAAMEV